MDDQGYFCCVTCDKKYKGKNGLYQHRRYDCQNVKQFECEVCHKRFSRRNTLHGHKIGVHGKLLGYIIGGHN